MRIMAPALLVAVMLAGCSFDLGSLMPEKEKPQEAPKPAATAESAISPSAVTEAQTHAARGQTLAKSGQTAEALEEFNRAVALDPYNAQALYGRALIYQASNQHEFAIADFSAASGLNPQKAEPLLGRANSYLAIGKVKEAASDLDEASEADPNNAQVWTTRGLVYERLGDKAKAAASYAKAVGLRPRDDAARSGLARVGG
jgi:Flp pilus assembly protein TadD